MKDVPTRHSQNSMRNKEILGAGFPKNGLWLETPATREYEAVILGF
jgi:hypothetical protein